MPKAVQFMASEIPSARRVALRVGSALAAAPKDLIMPVMVPSRPQRVDRLASMAR